MAKPCIALLLALGLAAPCLAQSRPTTKEERQRLLDVVSLAEQDPLSPKIQAEQKWAMRLIMDASDFMVVVPGLAAELQERIPAKNEFRHVFFVHFIIACAADVVRNPGQQDPVRTSTYALRSCLTAYKTLVKDHPERKIDVFEELLKKDDAGLKKIVEDSLKKRQPRR